MTNFWNKTNALISLAAIAVAIIVGIYSNRDKSTTLNIERVNATLLTQNLDIDGLTSYYLFHDSIEVKNLWKTIFTIKNTGETSLYGKGFTDMNVRNGTLALEVVGCDKVLNIKMTSNNSGSSFINNNQLYVTQWKPKEFTEIEVLTEGENAPTLKIDPRTIKDGEVTYSYYTPSNDNQSTKLIDRIPDPFSNILKWVIIAFMLLLTIGFCIQVPKDLKKRSGATKVGWLIFWLVLLLIYFSPLLWMF